MSKHNRERRAARGNGSGRHASTGGSSSEATGVRFLLVSVDKEPVEATVETDYRAFQRIIGNRDFTVDRIGGGVDIVCADDAHGIEHLPNACGYYGTYFFSRTAIEGRTISLSDEDIRKCRAWFERNRVKRCPTRAELDGSVRVIRTDSEEWRAIREQQQRDAERAEWSWRSL